MNKYQPFTYRIKCIATGDYYHGVRYARGCNKDDLWVKYFTSSKQVHELIKIYGKNSFSFEVRKTFKTAEDAISWETRVNSRLIKFQNYLNKNNGHRFSNASSVKGGKNAALKLKGATWWNNSLWNTKSFESPGDNWVPGYLRNSTGKQSATRRVKGVKLHWWNNNLKNILSEHSPGVDWFPGMMSPGGCWNNGQSQCMSKECPGPGWVKGVLQSVKDNISKSKGNESRPVTQMHYPKLPLSMLNWWNNGNTEIRKLQKPDESWNAGRLINTFENNRNSYWWTDGITNKRSKEDLSTLGWRNGRSSNKQLS